MARRWLLLGCLLACAAPSSSTVGLPSAAAGAAQPFDAGLAAEAAPSDARPPDDVAPGARCEAAVRLGENGASASLGAAARAVGPGTFSCALAAGAASAYFELDLSAASEPTPVLLVLDAPFAFEAALARGPCGDLRIEQCATPLYADERSRLIAATLPPDRYRLVVSAAAGLAGQVQASASIGGVTCSRAGEGCAQAVPVDPRRRVQSLSGTLDCAQPELQTRCASLGARDIFYELDLSEREGETLLEVAVADTADRAVSAALLGPAVESCGEVWMCGTQLSARLPPGRYHLAVSEAGFPGGRQQPSLPAPAPGMPSPYALRIGLSEPDCSAQSNDTWQTASELDPTLARQRVAGNSACGSNQFDTACYADRGAPDLFYRLDLRGHALPQRLHTNNLLGDDTVSYLLLAEGDGSDPQLVACDDVGGVYQHTYTLAPRLYYLVVDGVVRNAAPFDLELELSDVLAERAPCASYDVEDCMADSEPACAREQGSARCLTAALECGLDPSRFEAFCGAASGCCTGEADPVTCLELWNGNVTCR